MMRVTTILNEGVSKDLNIGAVPGVKTLQDAEKNVVDQVQKGNGKLSSTIRSKLRSDYVKSWKEKNPLKDVQGILDAQKISYSQLAFNKFNDYVDSIIGAGKT